MVRKRKILLLYSMFERKKEIINQIHKSFNICF